MLTVIVIYEGVIADCHIRFYKGGKHYHLEKTRTDNQSEVEKVNLGADRKEAMLDFYQELASLDPQNNP